MKKTRLILLMIEELANFIEEFSENGDKKLISETKEMIERFQQKLEISEAISEVWVD